MAMKMPTVTVSFKERGITAIDRAQHGIIALVFADDPAIDGAKIYGVEDIPEKANDYTKQQVKLCLTGYQTAPRYILCFNANKTTTGADGSTVTTVDYTSVLKRLTAAKFDWLAIPGVSADDAKTFAEFVKSQRKAGHLIKAVLPNTPGNSEGIVNFTNKYIKVGDTSFATADYCARVAGIIAGTPSTISCTYAPLPEATEVEIFTPDELDAKVGAGEFFFYFDGEKIKVARGVNSFVTTVEGKGEDFQKIKLVDLLDMIKQDIESTAHESYIGKMANSASNRALLCSAILGYFLQLESEGILERGQNTAEIDTEAVKNWRLSNGLNTKDELEAMNEKEIKELNTHDNVFIKCKVSPLDAIEDITINCDVE